MTTVNSEFRRRVGILGKILSSPLPVRCKTAISQCMPVGASVTQETDIINVAQCCTTDFNCLVVMRRPSLHA